MKSKFLVAALALAGLASQLEAQLPTSQLLYFSTRFAETPFSGRGGNITGGAPVCFPSPTFGGGFVIESNVTNSPGMNYVLPGVANATIPSSNPPQQTVDFVELANFTQFNLVIGDLDADLRPNESSNFGGVDAMWVPFPAPGRPANMHEIFVSSFNDSSGSAGFLGDSITEADMLLLPSASNPYPLPQAQTAPTYFIRQSDWEILFGMTPGTGNSIDLDAFTVDPSNGDIYASFNSFFTAPQVITAPASAPQSISVHPGDIIRIPGTAYTPSGPFGIVTNPQAGFAELVIGEAEVTALVTTAGGTISGVSRTDVYGLDLDPSGATHTSNSGFTVPNLLFTVDNRGGATTGPGNPTATAVYSTLGAGSFALINGIQMDRPEAAGMAPVSFNQNFYTGPMDAIDVADHTPGFDPVFSKPLHMDSFPDSGLGSTAGQRLVVYFSGSTPGALLAVFGRVDILGAGGFVPRWDTSSVIGLGGHPNAYIDPYEAVDFNCVIAPNFWLTCQEPAIQSLFNGGLNPVTTFTDPMNGSDNGDGCFEINFPALPAPAAGSPPLIVTFQIYDFSNNRLSTPYALQFD